MIALARKQRKNCEEITEQRLKQGEMGKGDGLLSQLYKSEQTTIGTIITRNKMTVEWKFKKESNQMND
jgi:hypothetical protein